MKRLLLCHAKPLLLATASGLLAAACTPAGAPVSASLEDSVPGSRSGMMALAPASGTTSSSAGAPSGPIVSLPEGAGGVATTRVKAFVNGFRQDIALKGAAHHGVQNSITVIARTSKQQTLDEAAPLYKPTESSVRSEIGAQFPKLTMQVSDHEFSNNYGPYGLALGRAGGDIRCAYMWQWIDENRIPSSAGVMGPVSIRVRLCQDNTSFDAMQSLFDNLSIGGDAGASQTVASADAEVLPLPAEEASHTAKPKVRHVAHHRKRVAKAEQEAPSPATTPQQTVITAPSVPVGPSAASAAARPSTDLPPQAFMGPKGAAASPSTNALKTN